MDLFEEDSFEHSFDLWIDFINTIPFIQSDQVYEQIDTVALLQDNIYSIRRRLNNDSQTLLINNMLQNILDMIEPPLTTELEDVKVTLTQQQFDNLKTLRVDTSNLNTFNNKECNICIEHYQCNDHIVHLPCSHFFHKHCIQSWLCEQNTKCPVCRMDVREN